MSAGRLPIPQHPELFHWDEALDPRDYLRAQYLVASTCDGFEVAVAMAMEQSAATTAIVGYVRPEQLQAHTVRVCSVESAEGPTISEIPSYQRYNDGPMHNWRIVLAIPRLLLPTRPSQLLNGVIGDVPWYGFLTRFRLEHLQLPEAGEPGPAFGVAGLRQRFGVARGPLLCRAQRPAVGVDIETMARLNRDVLLGGFHVAKDCELQTFVDNAAFATHVQRMVEARDEARERTGERKGYIANLVCEPGELDARWDIACRLDVDGVLIAPMVQGLGTLAMLAQRRELPILANNSVGHLLTRHPGWGIAHAVLCEAYQHLGADLVVTAGNFVDGTDPWTQWPRAGNRTPGRALPVIQGGLSPDDLPACRTAIGDDDFMLIVAAWLDAHPEGLLTAAGHFRTAVDALQR